MRSTIFSIVLVLICFENVSKAQIFKIKPIVVLKNYDGKSKSPQVPGAKHCGGSGELAGVRGVGCKVVIETATNTRICTFAPLDEVTVEIDYIPVRDMRSLSLMIEVEVDGEAPVVVHDERILNGNVRRGVRYTVQITSVLDPNLRGKKIKARYLITDNDDGSGRLCVEAQALIN